MRKERHEQEMQEKHNASVLQTIKELDQKIWKKYHPDYRRWYPGDIFLPVYGMLFLLFSHLRSGQCPEHRNNLFLLPWYSPSLI